MKNIRIKFSKKDEMIYISHLDLLRVFKRAFKRAKLRLEHTKGFNPQPKMAFATALSLGIAADSEYMDIEMLDDVEKEDFKKRLNESLPAGIEILDLEERTDRASIMSQIEFGEYIIILDNEENATEDQLRYAIEELMSKEEITFIRKRKKRGKRTVRELNIRPLIIELDILTVKDEIKLRVFLKTGSNGNLKPEILVEKIEEQLNKKLEIIDINRTDLFIISGKEIKKPM